MAVNVIQNVVNFTDQYVIAPYKTSQVVRALGDNNKFQYNLFGEFTGIREIEGIPSSAYDSCKGWDEPCETLNPWTLFKAMIDRKIAFSVDLLKEANTILPGMTPTGHLVFEASWAKMGAEIDATAFSQLDYQIPTGNKLANTASGYETDTEHIINTLNNMSTWLTNNQVYGPSVLFISASVMGNLRTAMVNNYGLASDSMLSKVTVTNNPVDRDRNDFTGNILEYSSTVYKWDNIYIYVVPDDRMVNKVILLDGTSEGQTAGGWAPDLTDPDFHYIDMMLVPSQAAAIGVRHMVKEVMVPSVFSNYNPRGISLERDLNKIVSNTYGDVLNIQNIGIAQKGDMFRWVGRVVYGVPVFNTWKHTILEVYNPAAVTAPTVTGVTVNPTSITADGGEVLVNVAGTSLPNSLTVNGYVGDVALDTVTGSTAGTKTMQSVRVTIPQNTGTARSITIKVTMNGVVQTQVATISQAAPTA